MGCKGEGTATRGEVRWGGELTSESPHCVGTHLTLLAPPPPPSLFLHPRAQNFKWEMIGEVVAAPGGGTMEAAQKVRPGGGHHGSCAEGATGGGGTMEAAAKPG